MTDAFDALDQLFAADEPLAPRPEFAEGLRSRVAAVERRFRTQTTRRPPMAEPALIPYLTVTDARAALEFYSEVLGATVVADEVFEMDDGRIGHVSMELGDGKLYMSDEFPEMDVVAPQTVGGSTMAIVVSVADADDTFAHAIQAGAKAQREVRNQHGARSGWFVDPWGHRWSPTSPAKPDRE